MKKYSFISSLHHAGTKGMKWGVRRYQNEDGSLTPAGKARYSKGDNDKYYLTEDATRARKSDVTAIKETSKMLSDVSKIGSNDARNKTITKNYDHMSNKELQDKVNRLNLEQNYGRLTGDTKRVRSGADWTREILQSSAAVVGVVGSAVGIYLALKGSQSNINPINKDKK